MHADSDGDGVDAEAFEVHVKSVTQNEWGRAQNVTKNVRGKGGV
jgi:hypothetical protein